MQDLLNRIGWTKRFFAQHLGVSERTVYNWCVKEPNPAAIKYLEKICHDLNV